MKDIEILLMMGDVIETVKGVTVSMDRIDGIPRGMSMEVVVDPGSPLPKMLRRQLEQGSTLDYKVLAPESYWFAICSFSARVNSIGTNEHEVSVGLTVMTEPVWKQISKRIWNKRKGA